MTSQRLALPQTLRIETAEALHGTLNAASEDADTTRILLDASAVQTFGTAGIQLLLSAQKTASTANRPLLLADLPEPFRDAWGMLGLAKALSALTETQEPPEEA